MQITVKKWGNSAAVRLGMKIANNTPICHSERSEESLPQ